MILRLLRFTADLSNEPKGHYTCLFNALGGRKKHPIAICLMLITELVCVVTLMREWTGLRIFGMTIAQCISKATHIYVGSAVTQSHVADFDF